MITAAAEPDKLDIVLVIQHAFEVIGRNLKVFAILGLPLAGLPDLLLGLDDLHTLDGGPGAFLAVLASVVAGAILQGALVFATVQDLNGQRASASESLAFGLRMFLPLIGIFLLGLLGVAAGLVLLIVPGFMLLCAWAVAAPAYLLERTTIVGAFGRSAELTRGHRWRIFGLLLIWLSASMVLSWIARLGGADLNPATLLLTAVASAAMTVVGAVAFAVLYVELRRRREGPDSNWMANILA